MSNDRAMLLLLSALESQEPCDIIVQGCKYHFKILNAVSGPEMKVHHSLQDRMSGIGYTRIHKGNEFRVCGTIMDSESSDVVINFDSDNLGGVCYYN